jgi:hypothetical protein
MSPTLKMETSSTSKIVPPKLQEVASKKTIILIHTIAVTSYTARKRDVEWSLGRYLRFCTILEYVIVLVNVKTVNGYDCLFKFRRRL